MGMLPGMADMLKQIDEAVTTARLAQLETVTAAMSRGVQVIASPLVKDGNFAIVVSPGDFKILQGK